MPVGEVHVPGREVAVKVVRVGLVVKDRAGEGTDAHFVDLAGIPAGRGRVGLPRDADGCGALVDRPV